MTNSSLVRFSRFAFGYIDPIVVFIPHGMWTYRIPYPGQDIDARSFGLNYDEIKLKRWRIRHKNYGLDFIWGYGKKSNVLVSMRET